MKILLLTSLFPNKEDPTLCTWNLCRAMELSKFGHTVEIIAPIGLTPPKRYVFPIPKFKEIISYIKKNNNIQEKEIIEGLVVHHPKWYWLPRRWFWKNEVELLHLFAGVKIKTIVQNLNPDLILCSYMNPFCTYSKYIKTYLDVPIACYLEGSDILVEPEQYPGYSKIENIINSNINNVICTSKSMKVFVDKHRNLSNTLLIEDGFDTKLFFFRENPNDRNRILSVGELLYVKGHDILLKALALLNNRYKLSIIGGGIEKENLVNDAKKYHVLDYVTFLGLIDHKDVSTSINQCNVFCMPSRSEGQCIAALEALACGRPVVAANLGGFSDYIIDGFNGFLFEPESAESLAFFIEKAFKTNWNYKAIADSVKTKFGWENRASFIRGFSD